MCGIMGYVGKENAAQIIYGGLLRLEYRGYDSAGIAVKCGNSVAMVKRAGRVSGLSNEISKIKGGVGIGHTRWATHGKPTDVNAHPHSSGNFYAVHNGIIENYAEIKDRLVGLGRSFLSETDSEVAVKLIDECYGGNFLQAVATAVKELKGSFALLVINKKQNKIIAVCNKSPVIIGYGKNQTFISSDAPALAGYADKICVLCDGDIAEITQKGVNFYDFNLNAIIREAIPNFANASSLELGDCPYYMLKEINEIPLAVSNTANAALGVDYASLGKLCKNTERVILTGCGTAYHAGLTAKDWIEEIANLPAVCETAGEWRYKKSTVDGKTLVVAISQSGETADTLEAVKRAKSCGAAVIAVTNVGYSAITRLADFVLPVCAGAEICVAATKSYCGQLVALYILTVFLKEREQLKSSPLLAELSRLPSLCKQVILSTRADLIAERLANAQSVFFIGKGLDACAASEGSLKMKEVALKLGEGYPAGELKHGTLALVDENSFTVAIICNKELRYKTLSAMEQISARGGKIVAVCGVNDFLPELKDKAEYVFFIPECGEYLSPVLSVIPLQLMAYYTALKQNLNPDKPRNLAKSVTVE